ncbi:unnamed protein product [Arabidopsis halleri]
MTRSKASIGRRLRDFFRFDLGFRQLWKWLGSDPDIRGYPEFYTDIRVPDIRDIRIRILKI